MKTKSIFLVLFAAFFSLSAISQTTGGSTGIGSNNGAVSGVGSGHRTTAGSGTHKRNMHRKHRSNKSATGTINSSSTTTTTTTTPTPTSIKNTGSSDGTMPSNNDPGKETTSDKGKTGPANGVVKKGKKK